MSNIVVLSPQLKRFILWALDKLLLSDKEHGASIYHVIHRVKNMNSVSKDDSECGYIIAALQYVYTDENIAIQYSGYLLTNYACYETFINHDSTD